MEKVEININNVKYNFYTKSSNTSLKKIVLICNGFTNRKEEKITTLTKSGSLAPQLCTIKQVLTIKKQKVWRQREVLVMRLSPRR